MLPVNPPTKAIRIAKLTTVMKRFLRGLWLLIVSRLLLSDRLRLPVYVCTTVQIRKLFKGVTRLAVVVINVEACFVKQRGTIVQQARISDDRGRCVDYKPFSSNSLIIEVTCT